jgi:outer membrane lipoprotein-sorting protein
LPLPVRSSGVSCRTALAWVALLLILGGATGCLVRRHKLDNARPASAPALLTAGLEQLTETLRQRFEAVETLNATVDLEPSLLSTAKGEIAEYKDVRGFILFRKPGWIRVIAQYPLVRSTAFDMVSDGETFRLFLPGKNLLLQGRNRISQPSQKKLENLRPQHLQEALLIRPPEANEQALIENWTEAGTASYIVHIIAANGGQPHLARKVWFDRGTLEISRQQVFDTAGNVVTDARYGGWQRVGSTSFPREIVILRPQDEYQLHIHFVTTNLNAPLEMEKFELHEPEGVQIRQIVGETTPPPARGKTGG